MEITVDFLKTQIERAVGCTSATVPGEQLQAILDLAARANGVRISGLSTLLAKARHREVKISGEDLRMVLPLALRAKMSEHLGRIKSDSVRNAARRATIRRPYRDTSSIRSPAGQVSSISTATQSAVNAARGGIAITRA